MTIGICNLCGTDGLIYPYNFNTKACCSCYYKGAQRFIQLIIHEKNERFEASWRWVFINHVEIRITDSYKTVFSPYW